MKEKAQFFANYLESCQVKTVYENSSHTTLNSPKQIMTCKYGQDFETNTKVKEMYLLLKDLKDITDEDTQGIKRGYMGNYENATQLLQDFDVFGFLTLNEADILRSKGYAVPWRNYSVEDLINKGWVKIKE